MLRPWTLALTLDREAPVSVPLQIVQAIMEEIHRGRLRPGMALPGSRDLAATLGVNRKTVTLAYEELIAQGWLTAQGRRATFVSTTTPRLGASPTGQCAPPPPPAPAQVITFSDGVPDTRGIPLATLSRAFRHALVATARTNRLSYSDPRGDDGLRRALAAMLAMERGLDCGPDGLCVVRGSQMGIFVAARLCVTPGDVAVVEALCYPPARDVLRSCGARVVPVGLDQHGLDVDALETLCQREPVRAVYITPHHQYPTTVMLSAQRRQKLLRLATQYGFRIIEDDYDNDFHFLREPVMPLASMDRGESVIYVGSLSKVLAPALRVGYMVPPAGLMRRCMSEVAQIDRHGNTITERAIAELMETGEVQRHTRRMLKTYAARRDTLARLLSALPPEMATFATPQTGLAFWLRVADRLDIQALCRAATREGVGLTPARAAFGADKKIQGIRIGFGDLDTTQMTSGIHRLARAFHALGPVPPAR